MNKFKYPVDTNSDINTIGIKARSLVMKKVTMDQHTTYNSFSEFKQFINDNINKSKNNNTYRKLVFPIGMGKQCCNVSFNSDSVAINYNDLVRKPTMHNGVVTNYKHNYSMYSLGNIYLGMTENRIYTVIGYGDIHTENPVVAVESFPVELLMFPYTKDFYAGNFSLFADSFNQRTITVITSDPNEEPITYYPCDIIKGENVKSLYRKNSISVSNCKTITFNTLNCTNFHGDESIDFNVSFLDRSKKDVFLFLFSFMNEPLVIDMFESYVANTRDNERITEISYEKTVMEIFHEKIDYHLLTQLKEELEKYSFKVFKSDVLVRKSIRNVFMLIGLGQFTNISRSGFFVDFKSFVGDISDNDSLLEDYISRIPLNRMMKHEGFADSKLVKLVVKEDDTATIQYTDHGLQFMESWFNSDKEYLELHEIDRDKIDEHCLTILFYMSQPFLMDVIHANWFNKTNIKKFLKRSHYVQN